MRYLLDANAVISLLKDAHSRVASRVRRCRCDELGVSSIVAHELFYGAYKSLRQAHNLAIVEGLQFEILDFTCADAREAGRIRAQLARLGKPIGPYDVLIAGQAVARKLTLITSNQQEFQRVTGLKLENWS